MGLRDFFARSPLEGPARDAYETIIKQARLPWFYRELEVPDTPDGRFEMLTLHTYLVLRRLNSRADQTDETTDFAQRLFDLMFADLDDNLREMGVGDLGVGKRIKKLAEGFYGRLAVYDQALDQDDEAALAAALGRNIYRGAATEPLKLDTLAAYVMKQARALAAVPVGDITAGRIVFAETPS